jgi:hypothetical protein
MFDLASPGVSPVSLRDTAATIALQRLARCDIETPEDMMEVNAAAVLLLAGSPSAPQLAPWQCAGSAGRASRHMGGDCLLPCRTQDAAPCPAPAGAECCSEHAQCSCSAAAQSQQGCAWRHAHHVHHPPGGARLGAHRR